MALEAIAMEGPEARVSDHVARLIATCSRGWERFFADHDDHHAPRFVPSVPERVFAVLAEVTTTPAAPHAGLLRVGEWLWHGDVSGRLARVRGLRAGDRRGAGAALASDRAAPGDSGDRCSAPVSFPRAMRRTREVTEQHW